MFAALLKRENNKVFQSHVFVGGAHVGRRLKRRSRNYRGQASINGGHARVGYYIKWVRPPAKLRALEVRAPYPIMPLRLFCQEDSC